MKSTTENSITNDGAHLEDAAVGTEESTRVFSAHDVRGFMTLKFHFTQSSISTILATILLQSRKIELLDVVMQDSRRGIFRQFRY